MVVAAGNYGKQFLSVPGDARGALTVGATDFNKVYAGFSSSGPTSDGNRMS